MLGEITALLCCSCMTSHWKTIREHVDEESCRYEMAIVKCNSNHQTEKQMTN